MGLDMYAYRTKQPSQRLTDFEQPEDAQRIFYWRKHPNLHGWMEQRYFAKGGDADAFNCVPVVLTPEDLDRLEIDVQRGELPYTVGFFFGESQPEEQLEDLAFIAAARREIDAGFTVYYSSWW